MKIRKARLNDWKEYYELKKEESKEYDKIVGKIINLPSEKDLKKEFEEFVKKYDLVTFFIEEGDKLIAYANCKIHKSPWSKGGYIDDLFVLKEYRQKGFATKLINEFSKYLGVKKLNKISLNVNPKNKNAIKLYKKLGFELVQYGMRKKLK